MKTTGAYSNFTRLLRRLVLALVVALAGASAHAADEPKLALVIANWAYSPAHGEQWPLSRPGADAAAISEALTTAGFTVRPVVRNGDKVRIEAAIAAFAAEVRAAGPRATAVFYYAGHGGADVAGGGNYIVPVDASPESVTRIDRTGVSVDFVTRTIAAAGARATLVIFDACRNPLLQPGETPAAPAPIAGWVRERERVGAIVSFAQIQDEAAMDDGVYAMSLAAAIKTRGLTIEQALDKVQSEVAVRSRGRQAPSYLDGIVETICLYDCTAPQVALQNTDQALSVLRSAQTQRPRGDQGQTAALQALMAEGRTFEGFDFAAISFARADLSKLKAGQSDFTLASLSGANFTEAEVSRGDFKTANLEQARLTRASAAQSSFAIISGDGLDATAANLRATEWIAASLRGAVFRNADLAGAVFSFADLRDADFTGADLTDAIFAGADLRGAKISGATIRNNDITGAITDISQRALLLSRGACGRKFNSDVHRGTATAWGEIYAQPGSFARIFDPLSLRADVGLNPCTPTAIYNVAGARKAMSFHSSDHVQADFSGFYDRSWINQRIADVREIFGAREAILEARVEIFSRLPHVQSVRQSLIAEMRSRARQSQPSTPPLFSLNKRYSWMYYEWPLLAALAATPDLLPADSPVWLEYALRHLSWDRRSQSWPLLFPESFSREDLQVVGPDIYRTWTLARARTVTPELGIAILSSALPENRSNVSWKDLVDPSNHMRDENGREYIGFDSDLRLIFLRAPSEALLRQWTPSGRLPPNSELRLRVVRGEFRDSQLRLYVEPLSVNLLPPPP